jgi:hypothetical protein
VRHRLPREQGDAAQDSSQEDSVRHILVRLSHVAPAILLPVSFRAKSRATRSPALQHLHHPNRLGYAGINPECQRR